MGRFGTRQIGPARSAAVAPGMVRVPRRDKKRSRRLIESLRRRISGSMALLISGRMDEALAADASRHNPVAETIVLVLLSNHESFNSPTINQTIMTVISVFLPSRFRNGFGSFVLMLRTQQVHSARVKSTEIAL